MAAQSQPAGNDPRVSVKKTFIIADPDKSVTVKCLKDQEVLKHLSKSSYSFLQVEKPNCKIVQDQATSIHTSIKGFLKKIEQRKDFKVGLQARFGKVLWEHKLHDGVEIQKQISELHKEKKEFHQIVEKAHVEKLLEEKEYTHERYRVLVSFTDKKDEKKYVATISESRSVDVKTSSFTLDGVYQESGSNQQMKINISLPGRRYDFRIADGSAIFLSEDTGIGERPFKIAREIVALMKRESSKKLSIVLDGRTGNEWSVTYLRQLLQRQYLWKEGKRWKVARCDVGIYNLSPRAKPGEPSIVSLDYSKIEIELWSQKFFPAQVRDMPEFEHVQGRERNWTTAALLSDFDEFLQIAVDITCLLDSY